MNGAWNHREWVARLGITGERADYLAWSLLAEGADEAAGRLITHAGPGRAIEAIAAGSITIKAAQKWRERLANPPFLVACERYLRGGGRVLTPADDAWPETLNDLGAARPWCLWLSGPGDLAELTKRSLAVVGSRAATRYGLDVAASWSADLAQRGITVVSGGAYGVDAAAHRGALATGRTVAVLAGGLDRLYPRGNTQVLEIIRDRFLLVSEAPPGAAPTRWRFLSRNRLIAALTCGTVVVEAAYRSGALSTVRHAASLGRRLGAVPGSVESPASTGCNLAIRDLGAELLLDSREAAELVPGVWDCANQAALDGFGGDPITANDGLDPAMRRVLEAIPPRGEISLDELIAQTGMSTAEVTSALGRLGAHRKSNLAFICEDVSY
ncbi:DNA-processing protein DprA [Dermabacteraceae bacterium CCM 9519]